MNINCKLFQNDYEILIQSQDYHYHDIYKYHYLYIYKYLYLFLYMYLFLCMYLFPYMYLFLCMCLFLYTYLFYFLFLFLYLLLFYDFQNVQKLYIFLICFKVITILMHKNALQNYFIFFLYLLIHLQMEQQKVDSYYFQYQNDLFLLKIFFFFQKLYINYLQQDFFKMIFLHYDNDDDLIQEILKVQVEFQYYFKEYFRYQINYQIYEDFMVFMVLFN